MTKTHGPVSITMNGRVGRLIYAEEGRTLQLDLELSGAPAFVLLVVSPLVALEDWSSPVVQPIPKEKQREIVLAIRRWEIEHSCPVAL